MKPSSWIATRYPINLTGILAMLGISLGVFALLIVSSVMNGFEQYMRSKVIGFKSDIRISDADYRPIGNWQSLIKEVESIEGVMDVSPVCRNELLIQHRDKVGAIRCIGIDFERHMRVTELRDQILIGDPDESDLEEDGILLGMDLSLDLRVTVGESVRLSTPLGVEPGPFGLLPRSRNFRVVGLLRTGMPDYDKLYGMVSLKNAQYFLGYGNEIDRLEIRSQNPDRAMRTAEHISHLIGDSYVVEDWSGFEKNLFTAIRIEKIVMFTVLSLMFVIVALNITGSFLKTVVEKRKELGILKALGMSNRDVVGIFTRSSMLISLCGIVIGYIGAIGLLVSQKVWHWAQIPVPGFPLHSVPVEFRLSDLILVPSIAFLMAVFASIYPASRTTRYKPVDLIQDRKPLSTHKSHH